MRNVVRLLVTAIIVSFFVSYGMAEKPEKPGKGGDKVVTQYCVITGWLEGQGIVSVNVKEGDLPMQLTFRAPLPPPPENPQALREGHARVLKGSGHGRFNSRGRLDFIFDESYQPCELPPLYEGPPPYLDQYCRYHLVIDDGIYDEETDTTFFEQERARIWDLDIYPETDPVWDESVTVRVEFQ
jgi:hypothetical protein